MVFSDSDRRDADIAFGEKILTLRRKPVCPRRSCPSSRAFRRRRSASGSVRFPKLNDIMKHPQFTKMIKAGYVSLLISKGKYQDTLRIQQAISKSHKKLE